MLKRMMWMIGIIMVLTAACSVCCFGTADPEDGGSTGDSLFRHAVSQGIRPLAAEKVQAALSPVSPFRDTRGHWAESYVARAVAKGLFKGYDENRFGPDDPVTRGQFLTVLYRQAGSPEVAAEVPFRDVSGEIEEFQKAIAWGYGNHYVEGKPGNRFEPGSVLRRQEAMKILYSCSGGLRGMETLFTATYDNYYTDSGEIAEWGKTPMYWGVYNTLISGTGDHRLKPADIATRAQLAKILVEYSLRFGSLGEEAGQ